MSSFEFIQLHRTFHELSKESSQNDDIDISRAFGGECLNWPNLIKEYRVIILSEAGSGKTSEIRNVAHSLRVQGKRAFFLRLEYIATDFDIAIIEGTDEAFKEWLDSGEVGWLFLDSVDEARLRDSGDFERAIRRLSGRIKTAKERAHIVITSRITAWRPKSDLDLCKELLPYSEKLTTEHESIADSNRFADIFQSETKTPEREKAVFKIVSLDDLSRDQVAVFVKTQGILESQAFLDAVERADAWSFTTRPQDLEELAGFWMAKGRIGTRLEIMQNSIERRLAERDSNRDDARPLSKERVRQGAMLLAAAATLTRDPLIRVPDGANNTKGIDAQSVLPDWNSIELATLLSRPVFDQEIYGTVRFHHRSVREYLTAEWFAELLKRETSRRKIEALFFSNQYGVDIVVPALRPILPWLAILDGKILERVRKIAPEIIFEGGDPARLPLDVRRDILREVCRQMADGVRGWSARSYEAVQRFANPDLTDEVCSLIGLYADNHVVTEYLLRMVWLGELEGAKPEAMKVALMPNAEKHARISAFYAVSAVGSWNDQEQVRQSFLTEASELNREWLAELLKDLQPTEETSGWLFACLEKSETKELFAVDHLTDAVTEFVAAADIELLPPIVTGLNTLLDCPPIVAEYCEVSEKFQWLIMPACKGVERLILARHSASLKPDVLEILSKCSVVQGYGNNDLPEVKTEFSMLVPAWPELNRALFWFDVQSSRKAVNRKPERRLIDFRDADARRSFWKFEISDFEYVTGEISRQTFQDNKLVALSLAFDLYKKNNRPYAWRKQLKKLVEGNKEISTHLGYLLRPPAQSQKLRQMKQQDAKWNRRAEANRKRQENYHADRKKYFKEHLDEARTELCDKPGTVTNSLYYLFNQIRYKKNLTGRWTEYNWKMLIPDFGEDAARFYRDGVVSFWRHHEPKLRSEGTPFNETPWAVIIGLAGIEIETIETIEWPKNLSSAEVELACKYASFELNGFPDWFPALFEMYPKIVCDFLMQEIFYELSIEKTESDTNYLINTAFWHDQWSWDQLAPSIYKFLEAKEPKNLSNLDKLLKMVEGSTLSDKLIEKLAAQKCSAVEDLDHLARWFALWIRVAPEAAIVSFKARIGAIADTKEQTFFAMTFVTHLFIGRSAERRGEINATRQAFKTPEYLQSLYMLMHKYIKSKEDVNRGDETYVYTGLRDNAQDARNNLFNLLKLIPGKESFLAIIDIAEAHPDEAIRPWIMLDAKTKAEEEGDIAPMSPKQVRDFHDMQECTPGNHRELAELAVLRLEDLKDDLEHGNYSIASILQDGATLETKMRNFIGWQLNEKKFDRYFISQEDELPDAKRTDLRFHGAGCEGSVPVELKLADNWSAPQLFERLENQLCGDYLRDKRSNRGIFLLVYRGEKKNWTLPESCQRVNFAGLIAALQKHWKQISPKFTDVEEITVIGIDLTKRSS